MTDYVPEVDPEDEAIRLMNMWFKAEFFDGLSFAECWQRLGESLIVLNNTSFRVEQARDKSDYDSVYEPD